MFFFCNIPSYTYVYNEVKVNNTNENKDEINVKSPQVKFKQSAFFTLFG